jgi:hypothetical protein
MSMRNTDRESRFLGVPVRWFVRVLTLGMVPVLLLALPGQQGVAFAASYGPSVSYSWTDTSVMPNGWGEIDCTVTAYWGSQSVGTYGVSAASICYYSEFAAEGPDGIDYFVSGSDADGQLCEATVFTGSHDGGDGSMKQGEQSAEGFGSISSDGEVATCRMTEWCYQSWREPPWAGDPQVVDEGCFTLDLGVMAEAPPTGCPLWNPTAAPWSANRSVDASTWRIEVTFPHAWMPGGVGTDNLKVLPIFYRQGAGPFIGWHVTSAAQTVTRSADGTTVGVNVNAGTWDPEDIEVIGVQLYSTTTFTGYESFSAALPQVTSGGDYGTTRPDKCFFYWGEKVAEVAANETDVPIGDLGGGVATPDPPDMTPPANEDPPTNQCGFSITDPSSWASAGVCALVGLFARALDLLAAILGLLGDILGAIAGLVGELLESLVALARTLLVPSDGFLEGKFDDVGNAFDDSTVGNYLGSFTDLTPPQGSSGCGGLAVDFSVAGRDVDWNVLEACSGSMATFAGLGKLILSVALCIGGGLACIRALGRGFGWSPGVGEGAS